MRHVKDTGADRRTCCGQRDRWKRTVTIRSIHDAGVLDNPKTCQECVAGYNRRLRGEAKIMGFLDGLIPKQYRILFKVMELASKEGRTEEATEKLKAMGYEKVEKADADNDVAAFGRLWHFLVMKKGRV